MLQPGDMLAGKYKIKGAFGEGAFGRVCRAEEVTMGGTLVMRESVIVGDTF